MADNRRHKDKYPVLCAWCEAEGKETVVNWIEIKGSHGICRKHRIEIVGQARLGGQDRASGRFGRFSRVGWI